MEENELYSSTTTGEGAARPPGAWWEEVWASRRVFLLVVVPSPASPLIGLSASLPGLAKVEEPGCLDCQPFPAGSLPRAQALLVGEGRAEGSMEGAALEPSVVRT